MKTTRFRLRSRRVSAQNRIERLAWHSRMVRIRTQGRERESLLFRARIDEASGVPSDRRHTKNTSVADCRPTMLFRTKRFQLGPDFSLPMLAE